MILVTGATGYVGGRLVPRLLSEGYDVRCLVRDPERLSGMHWVSRVDVRQGDLLVYDSLKSALEGVDLAYYLVHSMHGGADFHEMDLFAARNFAEASRDAGVGRIVYLGGLGDPETDLSHHLSSRHEVGRTLGMTRVPVTELRASVIVGAGSLSFEMVRFLTERIPFMVCPKWVFTPAQPIGIEDVLDYMVATIETERSVGKVVEIGGSEKSSYAGLMLAYAQSRGLKRVMIPVPVLTPRLSSYWVHWFTPVPASIVRPLIDGLRNATVVRDASAAEIFPDIHPAALGSAVSSALTGLEGEGLDTAWSGSLSSVSGASRRPLQEEKEGIIRERHTVPVSASPATVYRIFIGIGGRRGWFFAHAMWVMRGMLDRMLGGVGFRRGRRDQDQLRVGDALDFWRVEKLEDGSMLRLRAEMKLPGTAWLEFRAVPDGENGSILIQNSYFAPRGTIGYIYWYTLMPLHRAIFTGLARAIASRAEKAADQSELSSAPASV